MRIKLLVIAVLGTFMLILAGNGTVLAKLGSCALPESIKCTVDANNQFALEFYREIIKKNGGKNVFFSPYSISTALSMTYEGAREKTAEEMQSVFHFLKDEKDRWLSNEGIYNKLNKKDAKYKLNTANALWIQKNYKILPKYIDIVKNYYKGESRNLDFIKETEQSRKIINAWVEDKTNKKIVDLIPEGVLDNLTRLVLTNAVYFKGQWVIQFDKKETREENFKVSWGETVKVQMMKYEIEKEPKFNYVETRDLQILELPYDGKELSMLVLLPKKNDLKSLEKMLSFKNINEWKSKLVNQKVVVNIPKFKFESKYSLNENLANMGMPTAFGGSADFSGMDGKKDLYIGAVIHQAFVDVNEEGTEAAAATAIMMATGFHSEPLVPVFRADHPFIFIIQEKETGNILFMGRVVNPNEK